MRELYNYLRWDVSYERQVCVPNVNNLKKVIMEEAHCFTYAMHPDSIKMYRTIKEN